MRAPRRGPARTRRKRGTRISGRPAGLSVPGSRRPGNECGPLGPERGHGEAAAGPERPGRRGAGPDRAGPGRLLPELQHQAEVVCHLLRERHLLLHPGHGAAVAAGRHQALRRVLHVREHRRPGQHVLPDGALQAAEEDVRDHAAAGHHHHAGVFRVHPVCCSVVAQEGAGRALLRPAVPVHDLVQPVVHPVCKGRRPEVLLVPPGLRTDRPPVEWPLVWCFLSGDHPPAAPSAHGPRPANCDASPGGRPAHECPWRPSRPQ